jgi:hypothetical protein
MTSILTDFIPPRITLPDDRDCPYAASNGYCNCVARAGGDVLQGTVDVFGLFDDDTTIEINLEGRYSRHNFISQDINFL